MWVNDDNDVHDWAITSMTMLKVCTLSFHMKIQQILVSIVVSIPACHAGDQGSIPCRGGFAGVNDFSKV